MAIDTLYPTDMLEFADKFFWDMTGEEAIADKDYFLAFIMARLPERAFQHAREHFGFTDADFVHALENAPQGIFIYEEEWNEWNKFFKITPPLPFPRKFRQQPRNITAEYVQ